MSNVHFTGSRFHFFEYTGEAYDASQTRDDIKDGDILVATEERVVGIMVSAWPTAVGRVNPGEFHVLGEGFYWETLEGGKYANAAIAADLMSKHLNRKAD